MPAANPAIAIKGLTVAYDSVPVLWNVDLTIEQGVMMGVVGPNGAGKSTLLKSVLGVVPKLAGNVEVLGKRFNADRHQIAYVPQRTSVDWDFPTTVLDLVKMGTYGRLGWFRRPGAKEKQEALAALERFEMREFADRQIGELSGGQQQRAFLARAYVQNAPIYFLDEPFAAVDATTEKAIVRLLKDLRNEGKTIVVVHHDLTTITDYFDAITLVNKKIISSGPVNTAFTSQLLDKTYGGPIKNCGIDCGFLQPPVQLHHPPAKTSKNEAVENEAVEDEVIRNGATTSVTPIAPLASVEADDV